MWLADCSTVTNSINSAFSDAQGARFKLTIGFNTSGALLLPTLGGNGDVLNLAPGAAPTLAGAPHLHAMEVLFEIQSRQFLVPMNTSLDYSYFDAPRYVVDT